VFWNLKVCDSTPRKTATQINSLRFLGIRLLYIYVQNVARNIQICQQITLNGMSIVGRHMRAV